MKFRTSLLDLLLGNFFDGHYSSASPALPGPQMFAGVVAKGFMCSGELPAADVTIGVDVSALDLAVKQANLHYGGKIWENSNSIYLFECTIYLESPLG